MSDKILYLHADAVFRHTEQVMGTIVSFEVPPTQRRPGTSLAGDPRILPDPSPRR